MTARSDLPPALDGLRPHSSHIFPAFFLLLFYSVAFVKYRGKNMSVLSLRLSWCQKERVPDEHSGRAVHRHGPRALRPLLRQVGTLGSGAELPGSPRGRTAGVAVRHPRLVRFSGPGRALGSESSPSTSPRPVVWSWWVRQRSLQCSYTAEGCVTMGRAGTWGSQRCPQAVAGGTGAEGRDPHSAGVKPWSCIFQLSSRF